MIPRTFAKNNNSLIFSTYEINFTQPFDGLDALAGIADNDGAGTPSH